MVNQQTIFNRQVRALTVIIPEIGWKCQAVSASLQSYFMIVGSFIAFAHIVLRSVVVLLTQGPVANSLQQSRFRFWIAKFIFSATTQLPNFKATCHGALSIRTDPRTKHATLDFPPP